MSAEANQQATIAHAAERLRAGDVVAFPTETVYGLGADALREDAVARVFALKGRPSTNPLIVHVLDESMARGVASHWPGAAARLARAFWPGPLTIVVPRAAHVPRAVTAGGETVAVRCPDHPVALALLEAFGGPLVGPSANRSGMVSPTTSEHVRESFGEDEVLTLEGGPCRVGIESTVVSVAGGRAIVLRPGGVSPEAIANALGEDVVMAGGRAGAEPGAPLASPGLLPSHYAPRAPALLATREEIASALRSPGPAVAALVIGLGGASGDATPAHRVLVMPAMAEAYASRLYAAMREADALRPARILIERPMSAGPMWDAIRDRLRRATAPR